MKFLDDPLKGKTMPMSRGQANVKLPCRGSKDYVIYAWQGKGVYAVVEGLEEWREGATI